MMQLDQNAPPAPEFPNVDNELAVQRYFEELGLHELNDPKLVNEKKFTLALYKLIFEEWRSKPDIEYGGVTLRRTEAGWFRGVKPYQASKQVEAPSIIGKYKQNSACSAHFYVSSASLPNQTYHCNVWVYLDGRSNAGWPTLYLNVRVEYILRGEKYLLSTGRWKFEEEIVSDFQLHVSKQGWQNVRNDEERYWEICLPRPTRQVDPGMLFLRVPPNLERAFFSTHEEMEEPEKPWVVPVKDRRWIKDSSEFKAKLECYRISRLPVAEKITWENSKKYLARLLIYAIGRAEKKFRKKRTQFREKSPVPLGKALGEALKKVVGPEALRKTLGKAGLEALEKVVGPEALRAALGKAYWEAPHRSEVGRLLEALGKTRLETLGKASLEALEKAGLKALGKTRLKALEKALGKARLEALGKASVEAYEKACQEAGLKARLEALEEARWEAIREKQRLDAGLEALELEKERLETGPEALELEKALPMVKTGVPQLLEAGKTIRKTRRTQKKRAKKKIAKKKGAKKGKRKITGANITPS